MSTGRYPANMVMILSRLVEEDRKSRSAVLSVNRENNIKWNKPINKFGKDNEEGRLNQSAFMKKIQKTVPSMRINMESIKYKDVPLNEMAQSSPLNIRLA